MSLGPVFVGLSGLELDEEEIELLKHPMVGGVVLFTRNYDNLTQLTQLVCDIHALRTPHLLVSVDHEGGRVQRFHQGFTALPAIRRLGDVYEKDRKQALELAQTTGWLMASELRAVGIDFSFAPVLDIDRGISEIIGDRAFHGNPEVVADLAHAYMMGMNKAGMIATGKHFPGHGGVAADSHVAIPVDDRRSEDIMVDDLLPFERMVTFGMAAMMTAHVIYEKVDSKAASFSPFWIQEVLRKRLDYQGVIFSDDLEMAGAKVAGDIKQRAFAALEAGCDVLLVCQSREAMADVLTCLDDVAWNDPVSQLRLGRLHGHHSITMDDLKMSPEWHHAVKLIESYREPYTLDLV